MPRLHRKDIKFIKTRKVRSFLYFEMCSTDGSLKLTQVDCFLFYKYFQYIESENLEYIEFKKKSSEILKLQPKVSDMVSHVPR